MQNFTVYNSYGDYIIYLQKLEDTKTNEDKNNVKDKLHASFYGNKFLVTKIIHKITNQEIDECYNPYFSKKIKYIKNKIVEKINYNGLTKGIRFWLTIDAAKFHELPTNYTGHALSYYDNGQIDIECDFINGNEHGHYIKYYNNGNKWFECNYIDGKLNGKSFGYYLDGHIHAECNYIDGKEYGE